MKTKEITASLEDYLEAIYNIIEEKRGVKAIDISKKLGVSRSSVTEALKNLADKGLINYGRYEVISLAPKGVKVAQQVTQKHKVLYEFLKEFLGVDIAEAQENACRMEHVISEDVLKRLISFNEFNNINAQNQRYIREFHDFCNKK